MYCQRSGGSQGLILHFLANHPLVLTSGWLVKKWRILFALANKFLQAYHREKSSYTINSMDAFFRTHLNKSSLAKTCHDKRLSHPSSSIGCRSVNLGKVFARKRPSTMGTPTTISVYDDLSSSQTSITLKRKPSTKCYPWYQINNKCFDYLTKILNYHKWTMNMSCLSKSFKVVRTLFWLTI